MTDLTHRAEAALIGALLNDPKLLDDVPHLRPDDFVDPRHELIFRTIGEIRAAHPGLYGAALAERVESYLFEPIISAAYLDDLALSCPEPQAAAVYGRLVHEASLRRTLATHAERLADAAGTERGQSPERDHLARLAEALGTHTRNLDRYLGDGTPGDPATTSDAPGGATGDAEPTESADADSRVRREELILADLIQHPQVVGDVAAWLDPQVFTTPERRELFETIIAVDGYGEPVDELTLSWELGRRRALTDTLNGQPVETWRTEPHPATSYIAHLAEAAAVEVGVAVEIGRDLLTDHVRAEFTAQSRLAAHLNGNGTQPARAATASTGQQRAITHTTQTSRPPLLQPPPTPTLGDDGPQQRQQ